MIYDNISRIAKEQRLNVHQLEIMCGLANGTIRQWKDGCTVRNLYRVSKILGVSMEDLLGEDYDDQNR